VIAISIWASGLIQEVDWHTNTKLALGQVHFRWYQLQPGKHREEANRRAMSEYKVAIHWERQDQVFTDKRYSRSHTWVFDGGIEVPASSSPHVVPLPYSNANAVDPEEAFVASLSSCHMLWFLSIAAKRGYCIDSYADDAVGIMEKDQSGRLAMTRVTLRPRAIFSGKPSPSEVELRAMHHQAHEECFIANSVKTDVRCEPVNVAKAHS
jgi:organic hydroperoxide reductase OsmC/OhrA